MTADSPFSAWGVGGADVITTTAITSRNVVIGGAEGDTISLGDGENTVVGDDGRAVFEDNILRRVESIVTDVLGVSVLTIDEFGNVIESGMRSGRFRASAKNANTSSIGLSMVCSCSLMNSFMDLVEAGMVRKCSAARVVDRRFARRQSTSPIFL